MSFDFRADQTRTGRIISSGSAPLLIYPSSSANDLAGGLTGFSTASVGTDVFFYVSGSSDAKTVFGGDVRISGSLTGSIRTVDGTNAFIVGNGITTNYNSSGQYELTASSVGGSDTEVQFNQNGTLSGDSVFTYSSGSLGVQVISGNNTSIAGLTALGTGPGLLVDSNLALSNSFMLMSGIDPLNELGGVVLTDRASINMFSGSVDETPVFSVEPSTTANWASVSVNGDFSLKSGSLALASPAGEWALRVYSGSLTPSPGSFTVAPGLIADELVVVLTGAMTASRISAPQITGSIRYSQDASSFVVGQGINVAYNSTGQWELTGAIQRVNVANYSRSNLNAATVIGYAYFNPSDYPTISGLSIEVVGMNMGGVSGGLSLYNQDDATVETTLSWSGASTLTTGSYQTSALSVPLSSKSYEIHLSQSGGVDGGASYTSVGFVNFRIS